MALPVARRSVWTRLLQWTLFAVLLGISSVVLKWAVTVIRGDAIQLDKLLGDGELFIVAVALAGAALSDIVEAKANHAIRQTAAFVAVICIMVGAALYAIPQYGPKPPERNVAVSSVVLFVSAVLAGATGVILKD